MLPNQPTYNDNHQSILIVDDDSLVLELLSQGLIMFGFQVFEADNGIDAWNTFKGEQIDVVLTDINMPGLGECGHKK